MVAGDLQPANIDRVMNDCSKKESKIKTKASTVNHVYYFSNQLPERLCDSSRPYRTVQTIRVSNVSEIRSKVITVTPKWYD